MDENKLKVLKESGYTVFKSCGLCEHFRSGIGVNFGTCKIQIYDHLKHSGPPREISVTEYGGCQKWEPNSLNFYGTLGTYVQFIPK